MSLRVVWKQGGYLSKLSLKKLEFLTNEFKQLKNPLSTMHFIKAGGLDHIWCFKGIGYTFIRELLEYLIAFRYLSPEEAFKAWWHIYK